MKAVREFINRNSNHLRNKVKDLQLIGKGGFNTVFEIQYDGPSELVARVVTVHNPNRYSDEELKIRYNK